MRGTTAAVLLGALLLLPACGDDTTTVPPEAGPAPDPAEVVECETRIDDRGSNEDGFDDREPEESPSRALLGYAEDLMPSWPRDGWDEQGGSDRWRLWTWSDTSDVGDEVRMAVVVVRGETVSGEGWYPGSWAQCDLAELPAVAERLGLELWTEVDDAPVPVSELVGAAGPEHCDWQRSTILTHGDETYWRLPSEDLRDFLAGEYVASMPLPADAEPTAYRREGERLWLAADGRAAYVGTRGDVERWPREVERIGCA